MNLVKLVCVHTLIIASFNVFPGAIFGFDDRQTILAASPWSDLARSTAVAVLQSKIVRQSDNTFDLNVDDLSDYFCPSERFRDQAVTDRTPFTLSTGSLNSHEALSMIGYPLGFPTQVATNGYILFNDATRDSFFTNLDAFEGNSGSPVLNAKNEVVGILVGGTPSISFVKVLRRQCVRFNACTSTGENCLLPEDHDFERIQNVGSEVQRIKPVLELLEKQNSQALLF